MLEHNGKIVTGNGFCVDDFTEQAMAFMAGATEKKKPFFAYIPYNTPHSPINREPEKEKSLHLRAALAMCENVDWNVGRVMDKLDTLGIADNTIVMYFCDNGPNGVRWNGDMKDKIPAGKQVRSIASALDLHPTLADMAGIDVVGSKKLDGVSMKNALIGKEEVSGTRLVFSTWKGRVSLRNLRFRLDDKGKLFDMTKDPGQRTDVAAEFPLVAERLRKRQKAFRERHVKAPDDQRPFVIGHASMPDTQIPARDGTAHGNIKRSNKFPNCSFFTDWKTAEDKVAWSAEVGVAGDYDVDLYYTCPAADVGSTIELRFVDEAGDVSSLKAKIKDAHDPPLRGAADDRSPRVESLVKDFKVLGMGRLNLPSGPGMLTLQATEVPGSQVMDFRLLMLRRAGSATGKE